MTRTEELARRWSAVMMSNYKVPPVALDHGCSSPIAPSKTGITSRSVSNVCRSSENTFIGLDCCAVVIGRL